MQRQQDPASSPLVRPEDHGIDSVPAGLHHRPAAGLRSQRQVGERDPGFVVADRRQAQDPFLDGPPPVERGHVGVQKLLVVDGVVVAVGVDGVVPRNVGLGGDDGGPWVKGLPRLPLHLEDGNASQGAAHLRTAAGLGEHLGPERLGAATVVHDQVVHDEEAGDAEGVATDRRSVKPKGRAREGAVGHGDPFASGIQVHDFVIPEDVVRDRPGLSIEEEAQHPVVLAQVGVLWTRLGGHELGVLERRDPVPPDRAADHVLDGQIAAQLPRIRHQLDLPRGMTACVEARGGKRQHDRGPLWHGDARRAVQATSRRR